MRQRRRKRGMMKDFGEGRETIKDGERRLR